MSGARPLYPGLDSSRRATLPRLISRLRLQDVGGIRSSRAISNRLVVLVRSYVVDRSKALPGSEHNALTAFAIYLKWSQLGESVNPTHRPRLYEHCWGLRFREERRFAPLGQRRDLLGARTRARRR